MLKHNGSLFPEQGPYEQGLGLGLSKNDISNGCTSTIGDDISVFEWQIIALESPPQGSSWVSLNKVKLEPST